MPQKEILELIEGLNSVYNLHKDKLPYHINVIDLLQANENAHSRILMHLLEYSTNGRYEVLESFIDTFIDHFNGKIEKPVFSTEKHRIDLLVRENDYAIIIENKIHNAIDQHKQIERYIKEVGRAYGISNSNIYVAYLPSDASKQVQEYSLTPEAKEMLDDKRFYQVAFRDSILPWLKEDILPQCRIKDQHLRSAIEQYTDHLEGLYDLRSANKEINTKMQEFLKEALSLKDEPHNNIEIIKDKIIQTNKLLNQLTALKGDAEKECWDRWFKQLKTDFPEYEVFDNSNDRRYPNVGICFTVNNLKFAVLIEKEVNVYYGIGRQFSTDEIEPKVNEYVKSILNEHRNGSFKSTNWWYGWRHTSWEDGYQRVSELIKTVIQKI